MKTILRYSVLALAATVLAACGSSDDDDDVVVEEARFEIRITNLTQAQPISPVAVMLHNSGFNSFVDGETASPALELLAEGG